MNVVGIWKDFCFGFFDVCCWFFTLFLFCRFLPFFLSLYTYGTRKHTSITNSKYKPYLVKDKDIEEAV